MPDHLRTEKTLFKKIILSISPEVDFAKYDADASARDILSRNRLVEFITNELSSNNARTIFPVEFLDLILKGLKSKGQSKTIKANSFSLRAYIKSYIKKFVPGFIKNARQKVLLPKVDNNVLAFRVFLISKMNQILKDDCGNNQQNSKTKEISQSGKYLK